MSARKIILPSSALPMLAYKNAKMDLSLISSAAALFCRCFCKVTILLEVKGVLSGAVLRINLTPSSLPFGCQFCFLLSGQRLCRFDCSSAS